MNLRKSNLALLIAAAVLAVPTTLQLWHDAESFVDYSRIPLMFEGFTKDNVGYIAIGKPKAEQPKPNPQTPDKKPPVAYDQVSVQRSDKGWIVGAAPGQSGDLVGAPVLSSMVEVSVFEHLGKIRVDQETLIQANASAEQLEEYGLDEAHATLMRVSDRTGQSVIAQLYIGHEAGQHLTGTEGVRGVFVRDATSSDVVLYEFDKAWMLDTDEQRWLDRTLLRLTAETVTRLSIQNGSTGGKPIVFERQGNQLMWSCAAPPTGRGAVRQTEIESFVQRMGWVAVQSFRLPMQRVGNQAALGLLPPSITLEITFKEDGAERTAKFQVGSRVDGDENVYYLTSTEAAFLMTVSAEWVTALEVTVPESWFDPAGPPK